MNKKVVVVIPWRPQEKRILAFNKLVEWYYTNFPNMKVIVADSNSTSPFSLSNARNNGFNVAALEKADIVIFNDADSFTSVESLSTAIETAITKNVISVPYTRVKQHNREDSIKFFSNRSEEITGGFAEYPRFNAYGKLNRLNPCGGILVVPVEIFTSLGGFDEKLTSWGPEDQLLHMEYIKRYNNTFTYVEGTLHSTHNYPELREHNYIEVKNELSAFIENYTREES